jgi:hypothetical protein
VAERDGGNDLRVQLQTPTVKYALIVSRLHPTSVEIEGERLAYNTVHLFGTPVERAAYWKREAPRTGVVGGYACEIEVDTPTANDPQRFVNGFDFTDAARLLLLQSAPDEPDLAEPALTLDVPRGPPRASLARAPRLTLPTSGDDASSSHAIRSNTRGSQRMFAPQPTFAARGRSPPQ